MPVRKKQDTTSTNPITTESTSSQNQVQPSFHQQLREHIRDATRVVMEEIMREELTQFLGAEWGECCTERKGYRNGSYTHDLATISGQIEDLEVPRDRAGEFHTQILTPSRLLCSSKGEASKESVMKPIREQKQTAYLHEADSFKNHDEKDDTEPKKKAWCSIIAEEN